MPITTAPASRCSSTGSTARRARVFTCLSSDIVNHEFGHAVLDGLRPYYLRVGRRADRCVSRVHGRPHRHPDGVPQQCVSQGGAEGKQRQPRPSAACWPALPSEFGEAATNAPYLRSALNHKTMKKLAGNLEPHALSEVLTGTMFDILKGVFAKHRRRTRSKRCEGRPQQKAERRASAGRHRSSHADARHPAARSAAALRGDLPGLCACGAACRAGRQSDRPFRLSRS